MSTPRSPDRPAAWPLSVWLLAAWLAGCPVAAVAAAPTPAEERAALLARQQALSNRYDLEATACRDRFLVTDCIDAVNRQRREALAPVRERLMQIDEAERQRRADERRQTLAAKQKIREERMTAAAAAAAASAPRERQRMLPLATPLAPRPEAGAAETQRQQEAAERARQAQQRQAEVAERQARVARRLAEREARKGPTQPLPVPPAASGPR